MLPAKGVPTSPLTGVPGWDTDAEEQLLVDLARNVPEYHIIVELGSEYGRSAAAFLKGKHPSVMLYSIDLFPIDHPEVGDLRDAYLINLIRAGLYDNDTLLGIIRSDSSEAGLNWSGAPVALLFIDAGHTYDEVMKDILAWEGHVAVGGVVAFHDCAAGPGSHEIHFEVSRAVDDWLKTTSLWTELPQVDSLRSFQRMPK